jgi:hypothetical protein
MESPGITGRSAALADTTAAKRMSFDMLNSQHDI